MTIRVLLVDDHPIIRNGIKNILKTTMDIEVVGEAENGNDVIDLVKRLKPDVLVLDMDLPGKNGIQVTEELKAAGYPVHILAFSGYDDRQFIEGVINSGASGYLTKDEPIETVIEAIRGVADGQQGWLSRKVKAAIMSMYKDEEKAGNHISPREAQVYGLISEGKTNKRIAHELSISEKTVEKYIYNLFQKFDVVSRVQLAVLKAREKQESITK
jgi:DNA-binding NarL/FixJ family response regulator